MALRYGFIRKAPLKQKLTAIIMLTSLVVLLLASGSFIVAKIYSYRHSLINRLTTTADIIGTNARPAIVLGKKHVAQQMLASLANEPDIMSAYIFIDGGEPIAHYLNNASLGGDPGGQLRIERSDIDRVFSSRKSHHAFSRRQVNLFAPIQSVNGLVGVIGLQADLSELYRFIYQFIATTAFIILLLSVVAYLLSSWLQTIVSRPVRELAETIDEVSANKNFSIRASQTTEDEIGDLIKGFNSMLEQIETRDEQLDSHRQNLEGLVQQRTMELQEANSELHYVIGELQEANQAKSQFLAKMSHEIRTPMIGIMGMAEQLTKASLPEAECRLASTVHRSGETLLGILDDVLDYSKSEAGKLSLENIPFSLREVCEDAIAIFVDQAHNKGLGLICHVDQECHDHYLGDPLRIKQILLNLISNAVKFTASGAVVLKASCSNRAGGDPMLKLTVTDTGIGIPESAHGMVFDSFSQADNSMTRKFGGSGLGLAIVSQLAEMMGGSCGLQSRPGEGSSFWVELPLPHSADIILPSPLAAHNPSPEKTVAVAQNGYRILLVEDNQTTQQLLNLILTKAGYSFDIRENGALAMEAVEKASYDLVFMDCEMPQMDGFTATQNIRKTDANTPIIALTAHIHKEEIERCLQAGMNDCLNKPFKQQQLLDMLDKWLPAKPGARSAG